VGQLDLSRVIAEHPELPLFPQIHPEAYIDYDIVERFKATCEWLKQVKKRKTVSRLRSAYGLKHIAEREIGYITEQTFIAAAIHMGFTYQGVSPTYLGMSEVSINKIIKRIERNRREEMKTHYAIYSNL
jgi:hypothetical protein